MKYILFTFISLLIICCAEGQVAFFNIDISVTKADHQKGTMLQCAGSSLSMNFQLTQKAVTIQGNFVIVDSQVVQITPLKVSGTKKKLNTLTALEQKQFLSEYSQYELDYFTNELNIEIINPSNQWVAVKSRNWFIWYFRVGNTPSQAGIENKVGIQLFASTIIGDQVLTLNAPIFENGDFNKAGLLVNQLMETLATGIGK